MSQNTRIGALATTIVTKDRVTVVTYHQTEVVTWDQRENRVILHTGGWKTATTKRRMNQAAYEFGLPYFVQQKDGEWFVTVTHESGTKYIYLFLNGKATFKV